MLIIDTELDFDTLWVVNLQARNDFFKTNIQNESFKTNIGKSLKKKSTHLPYIYCKNL